MTVVAIDDTDSRTKGMCTTYVGHQIAEDLKNKHNAQVERVLLVRLNPAAKHKTRGNAAIAVHTNANVETAFEVAKNNLDKYAVVDDDMTNPATVVTETIPDYLKEYTDRVMHELIEISEAEDIIEQDENIKSYYKGNGRGRIGCLAAIGAWKEFDDWTYENITYRFPEPRGTERDIDKESVVKAANQYHPKVWDTIDRTNGDTVCVPHTPCPILHGIRGDSKEATIAVGERIESEPVESSQVFMTNQGTDVHLQESTIDNVDENSAYKIPCVVSSVPETKEGGHVFFKVKGINSDTELTVAAFEPTKNFRDYVRNLRKGDSLTICGGIKDNTLKLEKFKINELNTTELQNPTCSDCGNSMSSMGANQGYRCNSCGDTKPSKIEVEIDRHLEKGWYEVPPCARRHISKPLIRMESDEKTHPMT